MGQPARELTPYTSVSHFLGSELRRYRTMRDLSQEALGQLTPCDKALVSRTECGEQLPSESIVGVWDQVLSAGGALLSLWRWAGHERQQSRAYAEPEPDPGHVRLPLLTPQGDIEFMTLPRRTFLAGTTGAFLSLDSRAATAARRRATPVDVDALRAALGQMVTLDDQVGGGLVRDMALTYLRRVHHLINTAGQTAAVERALQQVAAEIAEHAGWLSFDAGRNDEARALYAEAFTTTQLVDDQPMAVQVLAGMSMQAIYLGRAREALTMIRRAQAIAGTDDPLLVSLLATREARAHAVAGDRPATEAALTTSRRHLELVGDPEPSWLEFHGPIDHAANAGLAYADLGLNQMAAELLADAIDGQNPMRVRNVTLYRVRRADALLGLDVEEACAAADEALDAVADVSSDRVVTALQRFGRRAKRVDAAPAREFVDRLAEVAG